MNYIIVVLSMLLSNISVFAQETDMIIRISEIEIDVNYLEEYNKILKEVAEASVRLEQGVISIFPMYQKQHPNQVRILEIYANKEAYESYLKTPHLQKYKTTTLKMVKSLKLIDMKAIDADTMRKIFSKLKRLVASIFAKETTLKQFHSNENNKESLSVFWTYFSNYCNLLCRSDSKCPRKNSCYRSSSIKFRKNEIAPKRLDQ